MKRREKKRRRRAFFFPRRADYATPGVRGRALTPWQEGHEKHDVDDENDGNDNGQREEKVRGQTKKQISKEDASSWLLVRCWRHCRNVVRTRSRLTMVRDGRGRTEREEERQQESARAR